MQVFNEAYGLHYVLDNIMPHNEYADTKGRVKSWKNPGFNELNGGFEEFLLSQKDKTPHFTGKCYVFYVTVYDPKGRKFDLDNLDIKKFTDRYIKQFLTDDDRAHLAVVLDSAETGKTHGYPLTKTDNEHTEVVLVPDKNVPEFWKLPERIK